MPLSEHDVVAAFGDPAKYLLGDGTVSPIWEHHILGLIELPAPLPLSWNPGILVTRIRCHHLIAPRLARAFEDVFSVPEAWVDLDDFGGCYAWRPRRRNPHELSRHSWGIAVDLDVKDNPQGSPPHMHPATVAAFKAQGFEWGGDWSEPSTDGMHLEFEDLKRLGVPV
jgi:hypothetical protein